MQHFVELPVQQALQLWVELLHQAATCIGECIVELLICLAVQGPEYSLLPLTLVASHLKASSQNFIDCKGLCAAWTSETRLTSCLVTKQIVTTLLLSSSC